MKNLEIIEGNYNAHINAYDYAYDNNRDYMLEYEKGYLDAIQYMLQRLGVNYEINTAGYITIEQETE